MEIDLIRKYAHLLINYCLSIKAGDKLYVTSTTLAEPLLREIYAEATKAGAHTEINMVFEGMNKALSMLDQLNVLKWNGNQPYISIQDLEMKNADEKPGKGIKRFLGAWLYYCKNN